MSEKAAALEAVRNLSEHATIAEIIEALSLLAAIRRGQSDAEAGNVIPHDEIAGLVQTRGVMVRDGRSDSMPLMDPQPCARIV